MDANELADVDDLFSLPVDQFVAARDDLVRRLKAAGHAEQARAVTALRRPTLAAWAVNQVVRADADTWEALVAAGRTVQKAQRRALSGVRDSGLRDASIVRRGLVEALADHAARVLDEAGARAESHLDDVVATFEAASADPDAATTIGTGRLSAPVHVTTDFSGTSALLALSLPTGADDPSDADAADGEAVDPAAAEARREAMRVLEAARSRAAATAGAAATAREDAATATARADEARSIAATAREAAERAEATADDLAARAAVAAEFAADATATAAADADAVEVAHDALDALA